jgi:pimeloyl-ACP methyl ester carboxylesterase
VQINRTEPISSFIEGAEGLRLAVDRWPVTDGQPVILSHGGGQTRYAWGATAAMLSERGYDVVSMDLRGHGESEWSRQSHYTLDAFRDDLRAVVGTFARPVILVGASLGGIASLLVSGEGPQERVRALVLVDITPSPPAEGSKRIRAFMTGNPQGFASLAEAADAVADYLPHRPRPLDPSGLMRNLREKEGRLHWHWDPSFVKVSSNERFVNDDRLERAARRVKVPTLLVRGDLSEIVSAEDALALAQLIPQARVTVVQGAGHMVAGDQNTIFGRAVLNFLDEILAEAS